MIAEPLDEELSKAIEAGKISPRDDFKARARILADDYGWDVTDARKIWCFRSRYHRCQLAGRPDQGCSVPERNQGFCRLRFPVGYARGSCCRRAHASIRFNIMDVTLHADAIHRGGGQIIPTARRVLYASALLAEPGLLEPVFLVEIQVSRAGHGWYLRCPYPTTWSRLQRGAASRYSSLHHQGLPARHGVLRFQRRSSLCTPVARPSPSPSSITGRFCLVDRPLMEPRRSARLCRRCVSARVSRLRFQVSTT